MPHDETTAMQIAKLLSTPKKSNNVVIVAFPTHVSVEDAKEHFRKREIGYSLKNLTLPIVHSGIKGKEHFSCVFGLKEKFDNDLYQANFLEKCTSIGKVSVSSF